MSEHDDLNEAQGMRARFSGYPSELLPDEPEIGETITFVLTARCAKHVEDETADGARRHTANFVVTSLKKVGGKAPASPDGDGTEPLFGVDDDADDDADDEPVDWGDE